MSGNAFFIRLEANINVQTNEDGTFRIEEFGVHYGSASFAEAIAWFAERLRGMLDDAAENPA